MSVATVTATVEASNVPPRVRLNISDTGSPAFGSVTVTRLDPDGSTVPVRTPDGNPLPMSGGAGLIYDYEMPLGAAVTYSTLETPANVTTPVTVSASRVWLVHVAVPARSMPVTIASFDPRTRQVDRAVFYPLGRKSPVVITGGARRAPEGAMDIATYTLEELKALNDLLDDSSILLLNVPAALPWGVPTSYISVGDVAEARLVDYAGEPRRYVTLPFVTVDRPAGGSQSQRTLADLLAYPTLASLQSAYPTLATVLAGP